MSEDEMGALDRFRDRLDGLGRFIERLDERMLGKLGKDDATMLMEYAAAGDGKVREDFLGRMADLRSAMRDGFQHNERETAASIYKATTESEARTKVEIQALTNQVAALGTQLTAIASALAERGDRRGLHPVWTYGGGGFSVASLVAILLYMAGFKIPGLG